MVGFGGGAVEWEVCTSPFSLIFSSSWGGVRLERCLGRTRKHVRCMGRTILLDGSCLWC